MQRRFLVGSLVIGLVGVLNACGGRTLPTELEDDTDGTPVDAGGSAGSTTAGTSGKGGIGGSTTTTGGSGGSATSTGGSSGSTGKGGSGPATGGSGPATGGSGPATGGTSATGGASTGGSSTAGSGGAVVGGSGGGTSTGGSSTAGVGGSSTAGSGGVATGGSGGGTAGSSTAGSGGVATGGSSTAGSGGVATGGSSTAGSGGVATGGTAGAGGGTSTGGTAGKGGGPAVCGQCLNKAVQDPSFCNSEQIACDKTKGCENYGECLIKNDCLGSKNPQKCAQNAGCKGSPQARDAFRDLVQCGVCEACQDACPGASQDCPVDPVGGASGGSGAAGTGGGTLEEQCIACQDTAFNVCQGSYFACTNDDACGALLQCFQGCAEGDDFCTNDCWDSNPKGQEKYYNLYYCFNCTACGDSCGLLSGDLCQSPPPPNPN